VDTLLGATYLAIAAEHWLAQLAAENNPAIQDFIKLCKTAKTAEADLATMPKLGLDTGLKAIHPLTNAELPIWIANYVLIEYGDGAVMAVPAHDERDWEFAQKYHLPCKQVIKPKDLNTSIDIQQAAYCAKDGVLINSAPYDGLDFNAACTAIIADLQKLGMGEATITYRLRDWGISRQRYWGAPIPMLYCQHCGNLPVPEQSLPVVLPDVAEFTGHSSPLKTSAAFYNITCPQCGEAAQRETDTFDTFFESSWYYARFACPDQTRAMLDSRANYWAPVDQYIGGIEHAILHLLYSRFVHKAMRDLGLVAGDEPFRNLLTQGMVLKDGYKMSKSKGNTVDPQDLIEKYGADTIRLFVMFTSPPDQSLEWLDAGVEGSYRFLKRLWAAVQQHVTAQVAENPGMTGSTSTASVHSTSVGTDPAQTAMRRKIHETIAKVSDDMGRRHTFNTAIAAVMELINSLNKFSVTSSVDHQIRQEALDAAVLLLSPIVPHITHCLWQHLGHETAIIDTAWPQIDTQALVREYNNVVVQVNGKVRANIDVPINTSPSELEQTALEHPNIQKYTQDKELKKVIVIPNKLVNIVIGA